MTKVKIPEEDIIMMSLGLIAGEDVTVTADGSDEQDAVSKIEKFLTKID